MVYVDREKLAATRVHEQQRGHTILECHKSKLETTARISLLGVSMLYSISGVCVHTYTDVENNV